MALNYKLVFVINTLDTQEKKYQDPSFEIMRVVTQKKDSGVLLDDNDVMELYVGRDGRTSLEASKKLYRLALEHTQTHIEVHFIQYSAEIARAMKWNIETSNGAALPNLTFELPNDDAPNHGQHLGELEPNHIARLVSSNSTADCISSTETTISDGELLGYFEPGDLPVLRRDGGLRRENIATSEARAILFFTAYDEVTESIESDEALPRFDASSSSRGLY